MIRGLCVMGLGAMAIFAWLTTAVHADLPPFEKLPLQEELPNLLQSNDGSTVATAAKWKSHRRAELKEQFQHYMYGKLPAKPAAMQTKVLHDTRILFGGKAWLREIELQFGDCPVKPRVLVVLPNRAPGPVPFFVGLNFKGNHTLVEDRKVAITTQWMYPVKGQPKDSKATEAGRGTEINTWDLEKTIDAGFGVVTAYNGDFEPDLATIEGGIRQHLWKHTLPGQPQDASTVMAWAWGIHRMIDLAETLPELSIKQSVVVGHSRLGKAAIVAAAFDERIAIAIPNQAGCGGTAPSRGTVGESVKQINEQFPHWFNSTFKQFNVTPAKLPFDQHALVALCAPRPVLFTNAVEDTWANPAGQLQVLRAATPVYKLLGFEGLEATALPEPGTFIESRLGFGYRRGKHSMTPEDWVMYRTFAAKWLR